MKNLKETGLINKYILSKTDGSDIDKNAKYFCLRYYTYQKDKTHMTACQNALLTYADNIKEHLPELAKDLKSIINSINNN